ncbi:hypothetical protein [Sphingopyxis macrogoltabida]|uniref:DUF3325 domain-containing protein n=1 Tax=Sphingopyxis macrogoltabida TaxID=33050 RepID=A0A0N9V838_SPHMC|nr:hypothetical protein [Sphingopyxis macrogoltabida]ALH80424.1 hypothetical protein AN936_08595 [Sphingopyxis macrogoltabida]
MIWLWLSAAFMVTTAGVHSVLGYRRLIVPLLRSEAGPLADPLSRRIIRFAWHATSVLMLISAAAVAWPGTSPSLLTVVGAAWLATGLVNAAYTRGRHIAWPALSGAGIFALIGALANP